MKTFVQGSICAGLLLCTGYACDDSDSGPTVPVSFEMAPVENTVVSTKTNSRATIFRTPSSFQIPVYAVTIFQDNGESYDLTNMNGEYIELAQDLGGVEAVLQSDDASIPEGTYTSLSIFTEPPDGSGFEGVNLESCAELDGTSYCTKSDFSSNAEGTTAETVNLDIHIEFNAIFPEPIEISADTDNQVKLLYDISNVLSFSEESGCSGDEVRTYADCITLNFGSPPTFAFFGERRTPEIYKLTYTDPDTGSFPSFNDWFNDNDKFFTRVWLFFEDDGTPLAMRSLFISEETANQPGLTFNFGGDEIIEADGSGGYNLREGDNFDGEQVSIEGFQRGDHTGQIHYYEAEWWSSNGQSGDGKLFNYSAEQEQ